MNVEIQVTEELIGIGKSGGDCWQCPIAIAISEALIPNVIAGVSANRIVLRSGTPLSGVNFHTIYFDDEAFRMFQFRFDRRMPVEPFSFSLDLPSAVLRQAEKGNQ